MITDHAATFAQTYTTFVFETGYFLYSSFERKMFMRIALRPERNPIIPKHILWLDGFKSWL